ncbi:hypothetical protein G7Y89_g13613 [Cudoniella acicularis]|uniref:Mid2 domain-containing protein n=1 Tax=Cudoniella acicularis TaxID=354080 RepID=A0A8H4R8Y6_9HELO|nr:hypothetical protein G7Y89_g13613 [Cudoniella acicularis]
MAAASFTMTTISSALSLVGNGGGAVFLFSNLISAGSTAAKNVSEFITNSSSNTALLLGNKPLPGDLTIESNVALTNLSLPQLKNIPSSLQILWNEALGLISLPALATVSGNVESKGELSGPQLPALIDVKGEMSVMSTDPSLNCSGFKMGGGFPCEVIAGSSNPTNISVFATGTATAIGSTLGSTLGESETQTSDAKIPAKTLSFGLSTGAKIGIGVVVPLVAIILVIIVFIGRKGHRKTLAVFDTHPTQTELPLGGHHEKSELPVNEEPGELAASARSEPHELCGDERLAT